MGCEKTTSVTASAYEVPTDQEEGDALDVPAAQQAMLRACRNMGQPGIAACTISAADMALWHLKARLLGVPLSGLLGRALAPDLSAPGNGLTFKEADAEQFRVA